MKKSVSALITGAVLLLNGFVSVNSAIAQGKPVPPPPAPSRGVPDILKPRTVPAAPGKPSGGMKPGVLPPPPGGGRTPTAGAPTAPNPGGANLSTLITGSSAGLVKRGMTIREVKQAMSSATFKRIMGPFDEPALSVSEGETDLFDIYPAKNTDSPTEEDTKAGILDVLDSRFRTREGVSIGMALSEITGIYGEVQQITHDPGSGAEWLTFVA